VREWPSRDSLAIRPAPFVAATVGYVGLAIALTWPLVLQINTAVLHDPVDPLMSAWILWWNAHHMPFVADWWNGLQFYPTAGTLAFSDHRVGLSLITSPIQWLGGSPILAYNIVLLLTFVLSALAAHALAFVLTRRHAAGLVAGLTFGFCPYRIAQIPHLEILASYWMPVTLLALHRYIATDRAKWLVVFALALWLQALSCSYYFFFFSVILVLWVMWFVRPGEWRRLRAVGLAWATGVLAILPVLLQYRAILQRLGLSRDISEIEFFSADITGVVRVAPSLAFWKALPAPIRPEGELFPGAVIVAVIIVALLLTTNSKAPTRTPWRLRQLLFGWAAVEAIAAMSAVVFGPWRIGWNNVRLLSVTTPDKPFSIAFACLALGIVSGPRFVTAFRARSAFAFYLAAALVAWVLSWGPSPRFLDRVVLYKAPYTWLMILPGFHDGLRVPARFAMVMMLMLAVAGALGLMRLLEHLPRRRFLLWTAIVAVGIVADGWMSGMPFAAPPIPWSAPPGTDLRQVSAVLELPLGDVGQDTAAFYRSMNHGRPVVNGLSGYFPPHYPVLQLALEEHDDRALHALAAHGPLLVVIDRKSDPEANWRSYISRFAGAASLGSTADRTFFLLPRSPQSAEPELGSKLEIRRVSASTGQVNIRDVLDGDRNTRWSSGVPQKGDERVTIELDELQCVGGVTLSLGIYNLDFPRELEVEASADGENWRSTWRGRTAGLTTRAALASPRDIPLTIPVGSVPARAIRLRQLGRDDLSPWSIADLRVTECPP